MTTNTTSPRTISAPGTTITVTPAMAGLIGLLARAQARQIANNAELKEHVTARRLERLTTCTPRESSHA